MHACAYKVCDFCCTFRLELGTGRHQGRGRLVVRANDSVLSIAIRSELYAQLARAPIAS